MKKIYLILSITGLVIMASCSSKPYDVKRDIEINVPASYIVAQVTNHTTRGNWSPWDMKDPDMKKEFSGPENGVGAKLNWSSESEEVGTGSLEVTEITDFSYVKNQLIFTAPFESESVVEWWFEEKDGVTKATWGSRGELPGLAALFMGETMDEMMGPDFETGLANLKKMCEENYTAPVVEVPIVDSTSVEIVEES